MVPWSSSLQSKSRRWSLYSFIQLIALPHLHLPTPHSDCTLPIFTLNAISGPKSVLFLKHPAINPSRLVPHLLHSMFIYSSPLPPMLRWCVCRRHPWDLHLSSSPFLYHISILRDACLDLEDPGAGFRALLINKQQWVDLWSSKTRPNSPPRSLWLCVIVGALQMHLGWSSWHFLWSKNELGQNKLIPNFIGARRISKRPIWRLQQKNTLQ